MTQSEKDLYGIIHKWCDQQRAEIPDQNRRYLMDAVLVWSELHGKATCTCTEPFPRAGWNETYCLKCNGVLP